MRYIMMKICKQSNLNDIKTKNVFLNFDNYIKYAKTFSIKKISQPNYVDKTISSDEVKLGNKLGFNVKIRSIVVVVIMHHLI